LVPLGVASTEEYGDFLPSIFENLPLCESAVLTGAARGAAGAHVWSSIA